MVKRIIDWKTLLHNYTKGKRRGPNQSPRVPCRAGGPHNLVHLGQVLNMETMRPLLAQTDKRTAVTLDSLRLPYITNVHYKEHRNATSCIGIAHILYYKSARRANDKPNELVKSFRNSGRPTAKPQKIDSIPDIYKGPIECTTHSVFMAARLVCDRDLETRMVNAFEVRDLQPPEPLDKRLSADYIPWKLVFNYLGDAIRSSYPQLDGNQHDFTVPRRIFPLLTTALQPSMQPAPDTHI